MSVNEFDLAATLKKHAELSKKLDNFWKMRRLSVNPNLTPEGEDEAYKERHVIGDRVYDFCKDVVSNRTYISHEFDRNEKYSGAIFEVVAQNKGRFFKFIYSSSSWEEGGLGDCFDCRDIKEVFPVQKTVTVYE